MSGAKSVSDTSGAKPASVASGTKSVIILSGPEPTNTALFRKKEKTVDSASAVKVVAGDGYRFYFRIISCVRLYTCFFALIITDKNPSAILSPLVEKGLREFVKSKAAIVKRFRGAGKFDITLVLWDFGGQKASGNSILYT